VLTDAWVVASAALTLVAATVLGAIVLPRQLAVRRQLDRPAERADPARHPDGASTVAALSAAAGAFNLLWAVVVVLMIVRPGSTTGV
jgi:hypothetical protein